MFSETLFFSLLSSPSTKAGSESMTRQRLTDKLTVSLIPFGTQSIRSGGDTRISERKRERERDRLTENPSWPTSHKQWVKSVTLLSLLVKSFSFLLMMGLGHVSVNYSFHPFWVKNSCLFYLQWKMILNLALLPFKRLCSIIILPLTLLLFRNLWTQFTDWSSRNSQTES